MKWNPTTIMLNLEILLARPVIEATKDHVWNTVLHTIRGEVNRSSRLVIEGLRHEVG